MLPRASLTWSHGGNLSYYSILLFTDRLFNWGVEFCNYLIGCSVKFFSFVLFGEIVFIRKHDSLGGW